MAIFCLSYYYIARILVDIPLENPLLFLFFSMIYFLGSVCLDAWAYFAHMLTYLLTISTASAAGVLIGAVTMSLQRAQTFTTMFLLTVTIVTGFYVTNVPDWIGWIKYLGCIFYGFHSYLYIELSGWDYYDCSDHFEAHDPANDPRCMIIKERRYKEIGIPFDFEQHVGRSTAALVAMLVMTRVLAYIALRIRTHK